MPSEISSLDEILNLYTKSNISKKCLKFCLFFGICKKSAYFSNKKIHKIRTNFKYGSDQLTHILHINFPVYDLYLIHTSQYKTHIMQLIIVCKL